MVERSPTPVAPPGVDSALPAHVLVIEDNADTRENLRDILELDGYRVECVGTAQAALSRPDWSPVSVVLLDWRLPDASGDSLLPRLRDLAPHAAIVITTGTMGIGGAVTALRHGAADYILKPIDAAALRESLARIRERRRLAREKQVAEEQLRLLAVAIRQLDEGVMITDPDLDWPGPRIVFVNEAFCRMTGYSSAELVGQTPRLLQGPKSDRRVLDRFRREIAAGHSFSGESINYRKDRTEFCVEWNVVPVFNDAGAITHYVSIQRDVTERNRAQQALLHSQENLQRAQAIAHVGSFEIDLRHPARGSWSAEFCRIVGRDPHAGPLDQAAYIDTVVHPDDREVVRQRLARALADRTPWEHEYRIVLPDGAVRHVLCRGEVIVDVHHQPAQLVGGLLDITELKRAEERALRAERLASIGTMVTGLAHESRNALQRSQACLEMLARRVSQQPEALDLIRRLQLAQDHLHQLYEEVRNFAAPIQLKRQPLDLGDVWRQAWNHLSKAREGRLAELRERLPGVSLKLSADAFRLEQVFRNLFENSLAAASDPVLIEVEVVPATLDDQPALRVAVRDNGPGLNPEQARRLFEPFFTTKTKGTGLGLPIAQRDVEAHGGRMALGSVQPGLEIVLYLPRG